MNWLAFLVPVLLAAPNRTKLAEAPTRLPEANLSLRIAPATGAGPWKMVVTNTSGKPVRIAADGRLLRFEFDNPDHDADHPTRRNKKTGRIEPKTLECKLPSSMRPSGIADDRALHLAPGAAYEEPIFPELYCFGVRERTALTAGTKVTPALGFALPAAAKTAALKNGAQATPPPPRPPFVAEPVGGSEAGLGPVKEITGDVFAMPSDLGGSTIAQATDHGGAVESTPAGMQGQSGAAGSSGRGSPSSVPVGAGSSDAFGPAAAAEASASTPNAAPLDPDAPRVELSTPARVDAYNAERVELAVTVRNRGKRSVLMRFRRDNLTFEVQGPSGTVVCGGGPGIRNIPTDLLTPLAGGASDTLIIRMVEPCPNETFAQPGLYQIRATLDLRASSAGPGVRAFSAMSIAKAATLLRIQTGGKPFYSTDPVGTATVQVF